MEEPYTTGRLSLTRRKLLSAGAGTATALAGLGAFAGSAAAYNRLDADFRGCSEVWIIVSQNELDFEDSDGNSFEGPNDQFPLIVDVVVADGQELECREVELTEENATTIPGQYGDSPLIKYRVSGGEKILGIVGNSPSRNPLESQIYENDNRCAQTPNTPSFEDAECVQDAV